METPVPRTPGERSATWGIKGGSIPPPASHKGRELEMHEDHHAECDCEECFCGHDCDYEGDQFMSDAEADADVLASAGFGTDEDYGCYGGEEW